MCIVLYPRRKSCYPLTTCIPLQNKAFRILTSGNVSKMAKYQAEHASSQGHQTEKHKYIVRLVFLSLACMVLRW